MTDLVDTAMSTEGADERREPDTVTAPTARVRPRRAARKENALEIEGLRKEFGEHVAVQHADLAVPTGSFFGIVGPNGAGKTTLLSMCAGLLRPDAGHVLIDGDDVWARSSAVRRRIGVLPDRFHIFDRLTGRQYLRYSGALRGMPQKLVRERTEELLTTFGLQDAAHRVIADYSTGMAKKIALASAMIHGPGVLVLDEPFEGLDPVAASRIARVLKDFARGGGTVVLSSHSMSFVQRTCDRVAVIVDGLIIAKGTMRQVRAGRSLEERFLSLVQGKPEAEELAWLHNSSV